MPSSLPEDISEGQPGHIAHHEEIHREHNRLLNHSTQTTQAHGGIVADDDPRLTNARTPSGPAGGVLNGNYPNPGFAADMATQAELEAHASDGALHQGVGPAGGVLSGNYPDPGFAQDMATQAELDAHAAATTAAHGGIVASNDPRLTNARTPTGGAGGVLSGNYPNPGFAVDMATQAELEAHIADGAMHGSGGPAGGVLSGTYPNPGFAVDMATQAELDTHKNATTEAHGGIVSTTDPRLTDARTPTGAAGGVLTGFYPNPALAVDRIAVSQMGAPLGVATLDASGVIPNYQLPPIAFTEVFPVANEAAMLALTAQKGDVAVRIDQNKSYMLGGSGAPGTLSNWVELRTPTDAVTSVDGRTGVVTLDDLYLNVSHELDITDVHGIADTTLILLKDLSGNVTVPGLLTIQGGTPGVGKVFTSDANGLGSWTAPAPSGIQPGLIDFKGDLIVGLADNDPGRLGVGSDGQILQADSTTATGLKWAAAPTTGIDPALLDAAGDIIVASGPDTPVRFPIGADGQVLTVDLALTTKLKWATPAAGGGGGGTVVAPKDYSATVGDGSALTYNVDHNLGTKNVGVQVWRESDGVEVEVGVTRSTNNRVVLTFTTAPATNAYRVYVWAGAASNSGNGSPESARVFNSANISVPDNTATILTFNSERFDSNDLHSTSTNTSRLTAKTPGTYIISATLEWAANATGVRAVRLVLNGTTRIADVLTASGSSTIGTKQTVTTVYELVANDYVEVDAYQNSGAALNIIAGNNYSPEFSMIRVPGGVGLGANNAYTQLIGDGSTLAYNVNHNLGTKHVGVAVWRESDGVEVQVAVTRSTDNQVIITYAAGQAPATNAHRVLVWAGMNNIVDAKGDLIVGTASDAVSRLPVGTDNQALLADAAQTTGVKWANVPLGTLGYAQITADQGSITAETNITGLSVPVTVGSGRRIRITVSGLTRNNTANAAGDFYIKEGATYLQTAAIAYPATANTNMTFQKSVVLTPSAGSHTYNIRAAMGSGTGVLAASATIPAFILIEDIGAA